MPVQKHRKTVKRNLTKQKGGVSFLRKLKVL